VTGAWSIFTQGGGDGSAFTWARDLLSKIGAPLTAGNEQMVYDWEKSEGGGGAYNPLNQGPDPSNPALTTSGSQYGGGAADYASWDAGLQGAADYLAMPDYAGVKAALLNKDPVGAEQALFQSPWASSHYGYGSSWSDAALPGKATALPAAGGSSSGGGGFDWNPLSWPGQVLNAAGSAVTSPITSAVGSAEATVTRLAVLVPIVLGGAAIVIVGLVKASGHQVRANPLKSQTVQTAAETGALA
jgi:hypothetical protein